ncbi:MAG: hypothetical protein AAGK66_06085 [Pseudomonadota bacterium]
MAIIGAQSDPGIDLVPITPNDGLDLLRPARAIRCRPDGTAGTLSIVTAEGNQRDTYINAGEALAVQVRRVRATGTSASGLEAYI